MATTKVSLESIRKDKYNVIPYYGNDFFQAGRAIVPSHARTHQSDVQR
jgi:hypothetical protein